MRAQLDQAEVVRHVAVTCSPCFKHAPRVFFGLDLGDNPSVAVVDEQQHNFKRFPARKDLNP
jgi:hypothetical protein